MLDNHYISKYTLVETIFGISSYSFFVGLALIISAISVVIISIIDNKKNPELVDKNFSTKHSLNIALVVLTSGFIGSKIVVIFENIEFLLSDIRNIKYFMLTGKSIVGGIIGGFIGIRVYKKLNNIGDRKFGNLLAIPISLGMGIGRIGCLLAGCCYGVELSNGFVIPTQIIELLFCFGLTIYLIKKKYTKPDLFPGELFSDLVIAYFIFRFVIEFLRATQKLGFFSVYQVICLIGVVYMYKKRKNK